MRSITKRIKEAWERALDLGYEAGYKTGEFHTIKRILHYKRLLDGEPTPLMRKEIEAILRKAEGEEHKGV